MKIVKDTMDENFLQSPMPFIHKIRFWIYGKESSKLYVKIIYGITTFISSLFFAWHVLGLFAVFFRKFVFAKKEIAVDEIIRSNAKNLGYTFDELINYLQIHHIVSVAIWLVILWVLVLFWRGSKKIYLYILFLFLVYFIQGIYFFGWRFITHELTLFDWFMFVVFSMSLILAGVIELFTDKRKKQRTESADLDS